VIARLNGLRLGDPHECEEPGGWPEYEITLSYYVTGTDDLEKVREVAAKHFERLSGVLADSEAL
jgi:hypothetical protein